VTANGASLTFPADGGTYAGISSDGLRLITASGGSAYAPDCFDVWYLGSAYPFPIVNGVCYSWSRAVISQDGAWMEITDHDGRTARIDLGPITPKPWLWATVDRFAWMLDSLVSSDLIGASSGRTLASLREELRATADADPRPDELRSSHPNESTTDRRICVYF